MRRTYFTVEVAKAAGISRMTLIRWLRAGKIRPPQRNAHGYRIWRREDIKRVISYKKDHYRKRKTSPRKKAGGIRSKKSKP